jgi:hypothetical protein
MIPTLFEGQVLAIEFSPGSLSRGDMLVYRQDGMLMVHRMLGSARFPDGRPSLRTRGDGLPTFDPHLEESRVVGRVIALQTGEGWRSTRGGRARVYAWCLAFHDYSWAVSAVFARAIEGALGKVGLRVPLRRWVTAVDGRSLRLAHRCLFHWAHPVGPAPEEAAETAEGDDA